MHLQTAPNGHGLPAWRRSAGWSLPDLLECAQPEGRSRSSQQSLLEFLSTGLPARTDGAEHWTADGQQDRLAGAQLAVRHSTQEQVDGFLMTLPLDTSARDGKLEGLLASHLYELYSGRMHLQQRLSEWCVVGVFANTYC